MVAMNRNVVKKLIVDILPLWMRATGSYVRKHPYINDLDILSGKSVGDVLEWFRFHFPYVTVLHQGASRMSLMLNDLFKVDVWHVPFGMLPFFRQEFDTGKDSIHWKALAKSKGLKLSTVGLFHSDGKPVNHVFKSKKDIQKFLLAYPKPS